MGRVGLHQRVGEIEEPSNVRRFTVCAAAGRVLAGMISTGPAGMIATGPSAAADSDMAIDRLAAMAEAGELDLPLPAGGRTWARWSTLIAWGRVDLAVARLAEGHTDAVAILAGLEREPEPGALYGVWASGGGSGLRLRDGRLTGEMRFCSGAHGLDRALVVADIGRGGSMPGLLDVNLRHSGARPVPGSWRVPGMAASDSADMRFSGLPVGQGNVLGPAGHYTRRPGFWHGGAGVAAVWLGGALGVLDDLRRWLGERGTDAHGAAHLGALQVAVEQTEALLRVTADVLDERPTLDHRWPVTAVRCSAEQTARAVLDLAPRIAGAAGLCREAALHRRLADLAVYVRQHHGERDLAELGRAVLAGERR